MSELHNNLTSNMKRSLDELLCAAAPLRGTGLWLYVVINVLLAITATFGNIVILAALSKESSLHPPSKILFRSMALTDLCVGLFSEPLHAAYLMSMEYESLKLCYHLSDFTDFTVIYLCLLSLFTLTVISVDRLLALLLGLRYRHVVTLKRVLMIMIFFATLSFGFSMTMFWNISFTSYYSSVVVLLCIAISICCYTKIYQKLRHHQAEIQHAQQGQPNGEEPLNIARYRKTVSSALWIQVAVVVCFLPMGVMAALFTVLDFTSLFPPWAFSLTLAYLHSTLNPILYCWKIREVRRAVIEILRQMFCFQSN